MPVPGTELHDTWRSRVPESRSLAIPAATNCRTSNTHTVQAEMMAVGTSFTMRITSGRELFGRLKEASLDRHVAETPVPRSNGIPKLRAERLKWVRKGGDYEQAHDLRPDIFGFPGTITHKWEVREDCESNTLVHGLWRWYVRQCPGA